MTRFAAWIERRLAAWAGDDPPPMVETRVCDALIVLGSCVVIILLATGALR